MRTLLLMLERVVGAPSSLRGYHSNWPSVAL